MSIICSLRSRGREKEDTFSCSAYQLSIHEPTELDISLHRKIRKNLRVHRSEVSLCIAVVNMDDTSARHFRIYAIPIISQRGQHKFVCTNGHLPKGNYFLLPFLINPTDKPMSTTEFTIGQ